MPWKIWVNLPVPALNGEIETVHRLYITVNGKRAIAESDFANNETERDVTVIPAPEQVFVTADPVKGLFHL
jgi:hypothetical protein